MLRRHALIQETAVEEPLIRVSNAGAGRTLAPKCDASSHVGLATSGSGDTRAGMITGLAARGAPLAQAAAAAWGVALHSRAGPARLPRDWGRSATSRASSPASCRASCTSGPT